MLLNASRASRAIVSSMRDTRFSGVLFVEEELKIDRRNQGALLLHLKELKNTLNHNVVAVKPFLDENHSTIHDTRSWTWTSREVRSFRGAVQPLQRD